MTTPLPELALRSHDVSWNSALWEQLPDDGNRYEVIDGVLYIAMAHSPNCASAFQHIDDTNTGVMLWSPISVFMLGCDPVQPDILVVRTAELSIIHDRRVKGVPALLVELLSPSNAEVDLCVKRQAYARAGVLEYWIVRPAEHDVLVCSQPDESLGDFAQVTHVAPNGACVAHLAIPGHGEQLFCGCAG